MKKFFKNTLFLFGVFSIGTLVGISITSPLLLKIDFTKWFSQKETPKTPAIINNEIVIKRVTQVAKLVSVEYYMSDIFDYRDERIWPFKDKKLLVIAKARVIAGFDLLKEMKVEVENKSDGLVAKTPNKGDSETKKEKKALWITLPPPEIVSIDPSYQYYDIQGPIPPETHSWLLAQAKSKLRNAAIQTGILENAQKAVSLQLQYIFSDFEVHVRFSKKLETEKQAQKG